MNIVMSGYQALCLVQEDDGYYFSADSFIEEIELFSFTGSCQKCLSLCGFLYGEVDEMMGYRHFSKTLNVMEKAGWQLFKEKEYLANWIIRKEV